VLTVGIFLAGSAQANYMEKTPKQILFKYARQLKATVNLKCTMQSKLVASKQE
jgi:hypothetical protein